MLGISHSVLGVTNCCVETLLIPLENTGRPCDQLAESDPKEPGCFEGRHPFQGGFPHPLNAAREIQRRTMRTPENYVTLGPALGKLWSTFPFLFLFVENRPFTHRNRQGTLILSPRQGGA